METQVAITVVTPVDPHAFFKVLVTLITGMSVSPHLLELGPTVLGIAAFSIFALDLYARIVLMPARRTLDAIVVTAFRAMEQFSASVDVFITPIASYSASTVRISHEFHQVVFFAVDFHILKRYRLFFDCLAECLNFWLWNGLAQHLDDSGNVDARLPVVKCLVQDE